MLNHDKMLEAQEKLKEMEKGAAQFNAGGANASVHLNGPENDKYSKEAKELYQDWQKAGFKNKTLDDAQKLINSGDKWRERKLS